MFVTPFQQHPLLIRNKMGHMVNTDKLAEDSLLVILASALPNWLLRGKKSAEKFFASPHAVPSLSSDIKQRTIIARMKVALAIF